MVHLRPIILALLLAVAGPAAAIPSSAPLSQSSTATTTADNQVYAPANTSSVMTLGEDAEETRAFARQSLDVGTSLAIGADNLALRLERGSFEDQYAQLESKGDQRDLIFKHATQLQSRTENLESREQNARRGVQNSSISATQYVRTIARIDHESAQLQRELGIIESYTDRVQFPLDDYLGSLEKRLISLEGSVRSDAGLMASGTSPSENIYVSVADNGVILSYISDGTYTREVFRKDHQSLENNGQLGQDAATDIATSMYPWAADNSRRTSWSGSSRSGYNQYVIEHVHGEVQSFIDVDSRLVFSANQRMYLTDAAATEATATRNLDTSTMPKGPGVTANESNLFLTVNRSYAGGPMYVALQENETGEFVDGTIAIDGETVGETTTDGGLWTLSPAGSFNVTATSGFDDVTVETRATRPIQNRNVTQG